MAVLTAEQIMGIVKGYGFADPITATAVVLGESGGNTQAENRNNADGSIDRGLWQINSVHLKSATNPEGITAAEMFELDASSRYALRLSKGGTDFNPWTVTRSRRFGDLLAQARAVQGAEPMLVRNADDARESAVDQIGRVAGGAVDAAGNAIGAVTGGVGDVLGFLAKALALLVSPDFWRRVGYGAAGLVLIYLGLAAIFGRTALGVGITAASKGTVDGTAALRDERIEARIDREFADADDDDD